MCSSGTCVCNCGWKGTHCDVNVCDSNQPVWNTNACGPNGCYTCGGRINWMSTSGGLTLIEAKVSVAQEFPNECGVCNPCGGRTSGANVNFASKREGGPGGDEESGSLSGPMKWAIPAAGAALLCGLIALFATFQKGGTNMNRTESLNANMVPEDPSGTLSGTNTTYQLQNTEQPTRERSTSHVSQSSNRNMRESFAAQGTPRGRERGDSLRGGVSPKEENTSGFTPESQNVNASVSSNKPGGVSPRNQSFKAANRVRQGTATSRGRTEGGQADKPQAGAASCDV